MTSDRERHHRRSIRLKGYDYSQAGAYFVTICTQGRACLFGEVVGGVMRPGEAGQMIQSVWDEMPPFYPGVETDEFVVMPDHVHGIVVLVGATTGATTGGRPYTDPPDGVGADGVGAVLSLGDVVHRFKTMTTRRYVDGVKQNGWAAFPGRLWQRNYYERIIRDEKSLHRIRQYILDNPARWAFDRKNPSR
jgi:putative transposase